MYLRLFIYGLLAALFAVVLNLIASLFLPPALSSSLVADSAPALTAGIFSVMVLWSVIEDGAKVMLLHQYGKNYGLLTPLSRREVWRIGGILGLGFAALEITMILVADPGNLAFIGNFLFHALSSILFAFVLFRKTGQTARLSLAFLAVVAAHVAYNVFIFIK